MTEYIYRLLSTDDQVHTYRGSASSWESKKAKLQNITSWHKVIKLRRLGFPENYGMEQDQSI